MKKCVASGKKSKFNLRNKEVFCRKFEIETDLHNTDVFVVDFSGEHGEYSGADDACVATLKTTGFSTFSLLFSKILFFTRKKKS